MTTISPRDASLLALLAERPQRNSPVAKRLFFNLGSEAQRIADALLGRQGVPARAAETAQGLRDWVRANKAGASKARRKRRK